MMAAAKSNSRPALCHFDTITLGEGADQYHPDSLSITHEFLAQCVGSTALDVVRLPKPIPGLGLPIAHVRTSKCLRPDQISG